MYTGGWSGSRPLAAPISFPVAEGDEFSVQLLNYACDRYCNVLVSIDCNGSGEGFCNHPNTNPSFTWIAQLNTPYTWAVPILAGYKEVTNPYTSGSTILYLCGDVDDDLAVGRLEQGLLTPGDVTNPGQFSYAGTGLNGAHSFALQYPVQPYETTQLAVFNNFSYTSGINLRGYYVQQ